MALQYEKGDGAFTGGATETISLADSTLTPIALKIYSVGPGVAGTFPSNSVFSMGFATRRGGSTQSGCIGAQSTDNVSTGVTNRVRNSTVLDVFTTAGARDYSVTLTSFGAGQFVLTPSIAANASGDTFQYEVWGGSDLTDAIVLNQTMNSVGATQAITGAGFQPSVLMALDSDLATTGTITTNTSMSHGFASSSTQNGSFAITQTTGDTTTGAMNWNSANRTDACLERLTINADTTDARWALNSFDVDGVTLGVVDAPTNTDRIATFLFIRGGTWEVGSKAKSTSVGSDTFTLANANLLPRGVSLQTTNQTAVGITAGSAIFCVGAAGVNNQGYSAVMNPEAIPTTSNRTYKTLSFCIAEMAGGATPGTTSNAFLPALSFRISGNTAQANHSQASGQGSEMRNLSAPWPNDQFAQAKVTVVGGTTSAANGVGVGTRMAVGAETLYRITVCDPATNNVAFSKKVAGVVTNVTFRSATWVSGDVLRAESAGTTHKIFQNGVQLGADIADSSISSGQAGVVAAAVYTSGSLDDWSGGDLTPTTLASDSFTRADSPTLGTDWGMMPYAPGVFVLMWNANGGSTALFSYLTFGDAPVIHTLASAGVGR